jgi:hypothetical protein
MDNSILPFTVIGIVLGLGVLSLAIWRWIVASHEDDTLHVLEASNVVSQQTVVAHKLEVIDRWGKLLTLVTVVYAIILLVMYAHQYWDRASRISGM